MGDAMIEIQTHPRDPWRHSRLEQEACERLLGVALDSAIDPATIEPWTRAAILADVGLVGGRLIDLVAGAYERAAEGQVEAGRRELRLVRDRGNLRRRLANQLDLYADELGPERWARMLDRLAIELGELVGGTEQAVRMHLRGRGRRERRIIESMGRA